MSRHRTPFAEHKSYNDESVSNSEGVLRKEELTFVCLLFNTANRIPVTI
jgi:hypothetical protein